MLAKGVVGEEDAVLGAPGDHVVRPVHHGRLHKVEGALADGDGVAGLHALDLNTIVGANLVHAGGTARHQAGVGRELVDLGEAPGMVHLHVIGDHKADLGGVDHLADALDKLIGKRGLGRVDKGDGLVHDEVGVVGDATLGGVAVERALVPVDAANPPDLGRDLDCVKHDASFLPPRAALPHAAARLLCTHHTTRKPANLLLEGQLRVYA